MRHASILVLLAALFLIAAPIGSRADEPEADPVRRSTGEVGPVIRAIDRQVEALGAGARLRAFRLDGDIQVQVEMDVERSLAAFRRAIESDAAVLGYLARDAVESMLVQGGPNYAVIRLLAADGAEFVPPASDGLDFLEAYPRILKLAREAKLSVNTDLWKRSRSSLADGTRVETVTIQVIAWGAAERDLVDLSAKEADLHAVGAVERDVRASKPHGISEEPAITIQWRLPARP